MEHDTIAAPDTASTNVGSAEGLATAPAVTLVDDELLVEEISIDGMCGVY
jgi:mycofactocin precursor